MSKSRHYDYIVLGCGGIGSAALYWLSRKKGKAVLGLEQYKIGHDNGGSQDHSRIIRHSYPVSAYINLTRAMFATWKEVEDDAGLQLVYKTGGLLMAGDEGAVRNVEQYASKMDETKIKYERLNADEIQRRFPQIVVPPGSSAIYEATCGLVDAATAVACHTQLARKHGAIIIENCPVNNITRDKVGKITVSTPKGIFTCNKLIVSGGAWTNHILTHIGIHVPLTVSQEQVTYIATSNTKDFTKDQFPVFMYENAEYGWYVLPIHGNTGLKVAQDSSGPEVDVDTRSFTPDREREQHCIEFCRKFFPSSVGPVLYTKTCLYATPPDRNFIVDSLKSEGWSDIIVMVGAGHAFKFSSLLGKIASELAVDGKTNHDIETFKFDRPAIKDANFAPVFKLGRWNRYHMHGKL